MPYPYYTNKEAHKIWEMARTRVKNYETFWNLFAMFWQDAPVTSYIEFCLKFKNPKLRNWLLGALEWQAKNGKIEKRNIS